HLGKSRSHIANTLRLLKLPASVRAMVQNGTLSAGHARALVGAKDPAGLADTIQKRGLSVRQTEKLVQQAAEGKARAVTKKKSAFIQKDVDILALEQRTTSQLGLKVAIDDASGQGRLIIEYKSLDQLDDVLARLAHPARRG